MTITEMFDLFFCDQLQMPPKPSFQIQPPGLGISDFKFV